MTRRLSPRTPSGCGSSNGPTATTSHRAKRDGACGLVHGEQNLIILTYATPEGDQDFCKERALTSFTGDHRETPVSLTVDPDNLGTVDDAETRERYAGEVERMREKHEPTDSL